MGIQKCYVQAKKNGQAKGFTFIESACKPISSTLIRKHLLKLRDQLCEREVNGEWTLKKDAQSEEAEEQKLRFREEVRDMLHADVIEYVIANIADLWIVPKRRIVRGGQPHNIMNAIKNGGKKKKRRFKKKKKND